jgi:hypothetical protein
MEARRRKVRTPTARQYDRNCVLAATAGQLLAAKHLDLPVRAIVVSPDTPFATGPIASDIRFVDMPSAEQMAVVVSTATLAFGLAAGMTVDDVRQDHTPLMVEVSQTAEKMLVPAIDDGSFARLVAALAMMRKAGERKHGVV